jgi:ubiquitin-protein ligase
MHDSPRIRRLRSDLNALERLMADSSVLRFKGRGEPVQHYLIELRGKSLARERGKVSIRDRHEVEIKLGASYPRTMPEIRWLTPIYHPNISEIGMVCLGGYGTHWVPSLNLDELCGMLWDMARFHNYDIRSPYNREAALWVANQSTFPFPLDARPLRDLRAALGRVADESPSSTATEAAKDNPATDRRPSASGGNGDRAATRLGRYAEFVRKFGASLHPDFDPDGAVSRTSARTGESEGGDELILLDLEIELRPAPSPRPPRPGPPEEIIFIA